MYRRIRRVLTSAPIAAPGTASPRTVFEEDLEFYRARLLSQAGPEPWCVDSVSVTDDTLDVAGWAIPRAGSLDRMAFRVNGALAIDVVRGIPRPDVGSYYWFYPGSGLSGFHLRTTFNGQTPPALRLSYADAATGDAIAVQHDFHLRSADLGPARKENAPPLVLIQRTHTGNSEDQYFAEGFTIYQSIDEQFSAVAGHSLAEAGVILDFGCGPGRLTRYLAARNNSVTAVDVDSDCITWCSEAFPGVRCIVGGLQPPLPLDDTSFDCVLAVNVLLHLREVDAMLWLEEWARVLKPGGLLIVSIASAIALTRARLSAQHYAEVANSSFVELSRNPDLDDVIADRNYYKNVFVSHDYVRHRWSALGYRILNLVAGAVGNHHDLVILRKD